MLIMLITSSFFPLSLPASSLLNLLNNPFTYFKGGSNFWLPSNWKRYSSGIPSIGQTRFGFHTDAYFEFWSIENVEPWTLNPVPVPVTLSHLYSPNPNPVRNGSLNHFPTQNLFFYSISDLVTDIMEWVVINTWRAPWLRQLRLRIQQFSFEAVLSVLSRQQWVKRMLNALQEFTSLLVNGPTIRFAFAILLALCPPSPHSPQCRLLVTGLSCLGSYLPCRISIWNPQQQQQLTKVFNNHGILV